MLLLVFVGFLGCVRATTNSHSTNETPRYYALFGDPLWRFDSSEIADGWETQVAPPEKNFMALEMVVEPEMSFSGEIRQQLTRFEHFANAFSFRTFLHVQPERVSAWHLNFLRANLQDLASVENFLLAELETFGVEYAGNLFALVAAELQVRLDAALVRETHAQVTEYQHQFGLASAALSDYEARLLPLLAHLNSFLLPHFPPGVLRASRHPAWEHQFAHRLIDLLNGVRALTVSPAFGMGTHILAYLPQLFSSLGPVDIHFLCIPAIKEINQFLQQRAAACQFWDPRPKMTELLTLREQLDRSTQRMQTQYRHFGPLSV